MENAKRGTKIGMFKKYLDEISQIIDENHGEFFNPSPITGVKEIDEQLYYEHRIVSGAFSKIWEIIKNANEGLEGSK